MLLGRSVRPPLLLEEGTIMTDVVNMRRESIDLEALLLSRTYLYTLFHKLFGRRPRVTWRRSTPATTPP